MDDYIRFSRELILYKFQAHSNVFDDEVYERLRPGHHAVGLKKRPVAMERIKTSNS
jgi:hypothetical protein